MSVEYGSPDSLPYVCVVYVCAGCGRTATRHGRGTDKLPTGWVEVRGDGKLDYACADCAPARSTPADR